MKIIIVGGGFCGSTLSLYLDQNPTIDTKLIDKKPYFEYTPSIPKLLNNNISQKEIQPHYTQFLKHVKPLQEKVIEITPNSIKTQKTQYHYDYLILCPGVTYPIFLENKDKVFTVKNAESAQFLASKLKKNQKIIIIGGGIVGVEAAAEIITKYPKKNITIIHPKNRLIHRNIIFASCYAEKFLQKRGVKIILNAKVVQHKGNQFILSNGKIIDADIGIWCAGNKPDTTIMHGFPSSIKSDRNLLNVNQYLQLKGYSHIFVGGDITNIQEEKTAFNADRHAKIIYHNIKRSLQNKPLKTYKTIPAFLIISLGKFDGMIIYKNFFLPGSIAALSKWIVQRIILISRH